MRKNTPAEWTASGIIMIIFGFVPIIIDCFIAKFEGKCIGFIYIGIATILFGIIILAIRATKYAQTEKNEEILQQQLIKDGIAKIDDLSPREFEEWVARLMRTNGYDAYATKYSGDYGIDVIAENHYEKIGIQVKNSTKLSELKRYKKPLRE